MGMLTTHVLDTAQGKPGAGIRVDLYAADPARRLVTTTRTNDDGRCDCAAAARRHVPRIGQWELVFHVGEYFAGAGLALPEPPFLDRVTVAFGTAADAHYHVPLLVSPWSYTTYRGS